MKFTSFDAAPLVLALILNLILTLFLFLKKVPGNFLISIIAGTLVAWLFGIVDLGSFASSSISFQSYGDVWMSADFRHMASIPFLTGCFSLVLVLVFENIGLVHSQVNGMLHAPEKNGKSMKAVSISTVACGLLGTSPTVSTVETAAGITAGGRTGLTSVTTGLLFLGSLFFMPLIKIIPDADRSDLDHYRRTHADEYHEDRFQRFLRSVSRVSRDSDDSFNV